MADSKDRFNSNKLDCKKHIDTIVYRTEFGREEVHQCITCGCGYVHNNETGENYG
jgi:hypothetical protein